VIYRIFLIEDLLAPEDDLIDRCCGPPSAVR